MTELPPDDVENDPAADVDLDAPTDDATDDDAPDADAPDVDVLADTEAEIAARSVIPVETGHPAVDEVLRSLNALDDVPVDEHVAVFEQAHEELRRTLSGAGDDQG
jgi:hypothetical protein